MPMFYAYLCIYLILEIKIILFGKIISKIKWRITFANTFFSERQKMFTLNEVQLNTMKRLPKTYVCSAATHGSETCVNDDIERKS